MTAERIVNAMDTDWWRDCSRQVFVGAAETLLDVGMEPDEITELLSSLHTAMMEEYGD